MALVGRLSRARCGPRVGWICRLCSAVANVAWMPMSAGSGDSVSAPCQCQNDRRNGQLSHPHPVSLAPKVVPCPAARAIFSITIH